jgi:uncharacterized protein YndB with AHSA1/START domain
MHGLDGTDWPNFTRYHEVVPCARLVYDHGATSADAKPLFHVTVTFRDLGDGRTELDLRMTLDSAEAARQTRTFVKAANGNSTWDRLAEHLVQLTTARDVFVINRSFDVDIETLFGCWTTPEQLAAWLPPVGFTMTVHRADIRTGGDIFYAMTNGTFTMHGRIEYQQIERPYRLVYRQSFTDANGQLARYPGAPIWPLYMQTEVYFAVESPTRTRVTVRWEPGDESSADERAAFVQERGGMMQGWTGSFDKLEAML